MLTYCLKCKKKNCRLKSVKSKQRNKQVEQLYYQNVMHMVVESEKTRSKRNIK